jgi:threonine dehydrogenase-like Zn-dependent dehydrogenase
MIAGWKRTGFPAIPGHEWSGIVDALGTGVDPKWLAQPCVADNVLSDGGEVGFEHSGGYGQYLLTEARNLYSLPPDFPLPTAALIEPLAVCVRALSRLHPQNLDSALVLGDGVIGLLMLLLLKAKGMRHIALVGGRPGRLAMARQLGATDILNYHDAGNDLPKAIRRLPGAPFPNIAEASGSSAAMHASLEVASKGGRIVVIGDYGPGCAAFPWNRILHNELEIIGSNASAGAWPEAVRLATTRAVPLDLLVSQCLPAASYAQALDLARRSRDIVKVVLTWKD